MQEGQAQVACEVRVASDTWLAPVVQRRKYVRVRVGAQVCCHVGWGASGTWSPLAPHDATTPQVRWSCSALLAIPPVEGNTPLPPLPFGNCHHDAKRARLYAVYSLLGLPAIMMHAWQGARKERGSHQPKEHHAAHEHDERVVDTARPRLLLLGRLIGPLALRAQGLLREREWYTQLHLGHQTGVVMYVFDAVACGIWRLLGT